MAPAIRAATADDIDAMLILWAAERTAHATTADTPEALRALLATDPGALLMAEDETQIVGALIAAWDGWRGNLYRLAVASDRRREGIGAALVRAGEARLRKRGARRVTALVAHDDTDAIAFWTAAAYPPDPEIGRHVRNL
jgi:ribosomal protein S18 acetylase RimI-like enzyme